MSCVIGPWLKLRISKVDAEIALDEGKHKRAIEKALGEDEVRRRQKLGIMKQKKRMEKDAKKAKKARRRESSSESATGSVRPGKGLTAEELSLQYFSRALGRSPVAQGEAHKPQPSESIAAAAAVVARARAAKAAAALPPAKRPRVEETVPPPPPAEEEEPGEEVAEC
eukprot:Hpha_TRINITY_DN24949_c0_g1::TRINITY_DN24949_c0_g1_i1::g.111194::m.111194